MKHIIERTNGEIIIEGEFDSVRDAVQTAVKFDGAAHDELLNELMVWLLLEGLALLVIEHHENS